MDVVLWENICRLARIQEMEDLETYLGVPMFHGRISKACFDPLLARICAHLAS